ncbi:hypothetical protein Tco_1186751 [Tanacetum coccineum]
MSFCRKACLNSFGEHVVHFKELSRFKYRQDMVRDVLYDICRRAGISAKKEAPVNFLTDPSHGRFTLRPADVLAFGWVRGKHACVDLTEISPLVGLNSRGKCSVGKDWKKWDSKPCLPRENERSTAKDLD